MAYQQRAQHPERRLSRSYSNARLHVTAGTYQPLNPRVKPSLPNLYHSQLLTEQLLEAEDHLGPVRPIRKMPKSTNLSLNLPALSKEKTKSSGALRSPPLSPPYQSPHSPGSMHGNGTSDPPQSPITALPQQTPHSPKERTKSIFSTKAFSKSQSRLAQESTPQPAAPMPVYQSRSPDSTPDLGGPDQSSTSDPASPRADIPPHSTSVKSTSEPHLLNGLDNKKRGDRKQRFGQKLIRTKSIGHRDQSPHTRGPIMEDDSRNPLPADNAGLKTAPLEMKPQDKRFRDMMAGKPRNRSADRAGTEGRTPSKERREPLSQTATSRDSQASGHFFQNIRNSKSRASDLGRGFFGKITRSGSSHDREELPHPVPQHNPDTYVPTTIRLGLVEQTRATRISKRLESSRDKTEFWLPALPWRCIDYLNYHGLEVEGLYRVSGSLKEIKKWQMRFDLEKDVDIMAAKDLYDVNLVASLLKDWLRNLPEQILPDYIQKEIMKIAPPGTERCPPEFAQALSQLSPFNYYLLFAITCHLSLLTSCYEKTKMDFDNLCVCIQPSLGIDRVLFKILIKDWRNCWQGCYTEKAYLERENAYSAGQKVNQVLGEGSPVNHSSVSVVAPPPTDESRTVSSASSSRATTRSGKATPEEEFEERDSRRQTIKAVPPSKPPPEDVETSRRDDSPAQSNRLEDPAKEVPMLSPYKPLSPMTLQ